MDHFYFEIKLKFTFKKSFLFLVNAYFTSQFKQSNEKLMTLKIFNLLIH